MTLELITLATSNSHLVFCFCNFIIAVLLVANNNTSRDSGSQRWGQNNSFIDYSPPSSPAEKTETHPDKTKAESVTMSSCCIEQDSVMTVSSSSRCVTCISMYQSNSKQVEDNDRVIDDQTSSPCFSVNQQDCSKEIKQDSQPGDDQSSELSISAHTTNLQDISEEEEEVEASENEEDNNDQDDELRRRIEQFIEKMNRGWQFEKMRTSAVCY